ncbi:unnamed protein product [Symbiodinium sp. CCMP2592]|nr:unnamed protein product [Symbiodinium sp. CCMP2592]
MGQQLQPAGKALAIDLPTGIDASKGWKYDSVCNVNGKAVAVPCYAEKILVVDPATGRASAIDLPAGIDASWGGKYDSVCNVNGKAVAVPCYAEKILVVDPATGQASAIDLPAGIDASKDWKYRSVCNVNGKAVAVPAHAEKILVVDPATGQASAIDLPAGIDASKDWKYRSVCNVNGKAVAVPAHAEKILVVDPATGQASAIDLPAGIDASKDWKYRSVCNVNGKAVAVPAHAEKILVVDPATGQASAIDLPAGIDASKDWKYRSVCNVNGKAVAVPAHAEKILVVDPATGQASAIDLPAGIDASKDWKYRSVCNVNGKAVAVPAHAEKILVVDPATGQASAIDLPAGIDASKDWKYFSVCNVNGKAVAVPCNSGKILIVELSQPTVFSLRLHHSTVQNTPVFAELVAALLSYWMYTDEPEPPHLEHASMQVHRVVQPGEFGSAVKIASVTADLLSGKVLYLVFKGTSYILDFLSWNLELNHAMTQDPDFFVHGGAAGTLHAASFWLEDGLFQRLKEARENGVRRVVFTGHSLGGMYAALTFYMLWKKLDGFMDFAAERAVNYINENDPCPRAWGAINLRQFVEVATKSVQKGLVDELGSVKGFVASQVVAAAAQQVLNRSDFYLLEDFAKRYQHFAELKVLSSQRQVTRWKEFRLTPDCLKDHSVMAYVTRLFDAYDDSRPEWTYPGELPCGDSAAAADEMIEGLPSEDLWQLSSMYERESTTSLGSVGVPCCHPAKLWKSGFGGIRQITAAEARRQYPLALTRAAKLRALLLSIRTWSDGDLEVGPVEEALTFLRGFEMPAPVTTGPAD